MNRPLARKLSSCQERFVSFFLPDSILSGPGEQLTRGRMLVWCSLLVGLSLSCVAAPTNLLFDQPRIALVNAVGGALCLLSAPILRVSGSLPLASGLLIGAAWLNLVILYFGSSDGIPSTLYSLAALPLGGTLLGGPRSGLLWLVIVVLTLVGIHAAWTFELPIPVPQMAASSAIELFLARDVLILTCVVSAMGLYFDLERARAVRNARFERGRADESEERFERAFASNPDAIAIWEIESDKVIECNEGFLRAVGLEREEVIGRISWCRRFGIHGTARAELLGAVQSSPEGFQLEASVEEVRHTGIVGLRSYLVSATVIEVKGKACVLATARDVTKQRQLDDQLRQSQKMEAIGQLAGSIAHDFNNMLTVILGYTTQLKRSVPGRDGQRIALVETAARRASSLTSQLLAFSRREVMKSQIIELNAAIRQSYSMLRPLLGSEVDLQLDLAAEPIHVRADPGQLDQVLVNLAINARDAVQKGGQITIRSEAGVSTLERAPSTDSAADRVTGWCAIHVSDTGCGMDDATLMRATEPFFTTKPRGSGTGLGLSTVHGIIGQNGGELRLASQVGSGTTATIHLPQIDPPDTTTAVAGAAAEGVVEISEATILLVEDEDLVQQLARSYLEQAGHRVLVAANGVAALELVRRCEQPVDLVVTDVVMPHMTGPALARALSSVWPEVPVLFTSGHADPKVLERAQLPENAAFVAKPFSEDTLLERVNALLQAHRAAAPGPPA